MLELQRLRLKKTALFEKAEIQFHKGTTLILGRNLNRNLGASNGSGKSLLIGAVPYCILDQTPILSKDRANRKLGSSDSEAVLDFKLKVPYSITKTAKRIALSRKGVDLELRTLPIAREHLSRLFNVSEEEFYSTRYLDSARPSMFRMGSSSQRFEFFTELFRLNEIDTMRAWVREQHNELQHVAAERKALEEQLAALPVTKLRPVRDMETELASVEDRLVKARAWNQYRQTLVRRKELKKQIAALGLADAYDPNRLLDLKLQEARYLENESNRKRVRKLKSTPNYGDHRKTLAALDRKLAELPSKEPVEPESVDKAVADPDRIAKLSDRIAVLVSQQEAISEHRTHDGECPTCGGQLTKGQLKKRYEATTEELVALRAKLRTLREQAQQAQHYAEFVKAKRDYDKNLEGYQLRRKYLKKYDRASMQEGHAAWVAVQAIELTELDFDPDELRKQQEAKTAYDTRKLLKRELDAQPDPPEECGESIDELVAVATKLRARVQTRVTNNALHKANVKNRERLVAAINKANTDDAEALELLLQAYTKGAIKSMIVSKIAKTLTANINKYSGSVYGEHFEFSLDCEGSNFIANVTRKNGKLTTDISLLSGAEGRLFNMLFLLAVLPLIPKTRRCDTLILDEPEAQMDEVSLATFRDVLLPALNRVVPKIVIATPSVGLRCDWMHTYTVTKKGNRSTVSYDPPISRLT